MQQGGHLEVVDVLGREPDVLPHRQRERRDPLGVAGRHHAAELGRAMASASIVGGTNASPNRGRSKAYQAARSGVENSSGPQMPTRPLAARRRGNRSPSAFPMTRSPTTRAVPRGVKDATEPQDLAHGDVPSRVCAAAAAASAR
jgi:hypothetical protein